jgi:hypothetical protein
MQRLRRTSASLERRAQLLRQLVPIPLQSSFPVTARSLPVGNLEVTAAGYSVRIGFSITNGDFRGAIR